MAMTLMLDLPRDGEHVGTLREVVGVALGRHSAPAEIVDDMQLVIAEAAGNVIRHAEGTDRYSVEVVIDGESCAVEIRDEGPGFDTPGEEVPAAKLLAEGGRGFSLMDALTDELHFMQNGETKVRFVKSW